MLTRSLKALEAGGFIVDGAEVSNVYALPRLEGTTVGKFAILSRSALMAVGVAACGAVATSGATTRRHVASGAQSPQRGLGNRRGQESTETARAHTSPTSAQPRFSSR